MPARRVLALLLLSCLLGTAWARGPWRAGAGNTTGWQLMTPEERVDHQRRMRGFDSYDACVAYQTAHHASMADRAQRAGLQLRPGRHGGCDELRAQGHLK